jgi:hypothetical protein
VGVAALFHGSPAQCRELSAAVEHNCTCDEANDGVRSGSCPAHRALLDQRWLDGLLFASYLHDQLLREEDR